MSIQAATGDKLTKLGVTDTASLQKIVPGFLFTPTYYGTLVYTIRGVGFQDTSLAGSPTVSAYVDEAPLPFSALDEIRARRCLRPATGRSAEGPARHPLW